MTPTRPDLMLFDGAAGRGAGDDAWHPVGDPVMGGVSESRWTVRAGHASFEGTVSLERGGGFASVRVDLAPLDLSAWSAIRLTVRGDGKRYRFQIRDRPGFDTVVHRVALSPPAGSWSTVRLPFDRFEPVRRGRAVDAPPLDPTRVHGLGFLISDRQAGPFRLDVAAIVAGS